MRVYIECVGGWGGGGGGGWDNICMQMRVRNLGGHSTKIQKIFEKYYYGGDKIL